jgi:hypothetical protein
MLLPFVIAALEIFIVLAFLYAVVYAFNKWVADPAHPIDQKFVNIFLFIVFCLLILYFVTGHSPIFWR